MPETRTHQRSESINQQLQWYRTIFHKAPDALLIIQPETWVVLEVNEQACQLLNIEESELLGTPFPYIRRSYKLLQQSGLPTVLDEIRIEQPRHHRTLMLEVAIRQEFIDQNPILIVAARDISEQQALTEKMIQTDKLALLGKLAGGIAHEIRNPLAAISLHLQSLLRRFPQHSTEYKQLAAILEGTNRINTIVNNTLNFSRSLPPNVRLQPIEPVVRAAVDLIRPSLQRNKFIELELTIEPDLPLVLIDTQQIEQVLLNLLSNAAEAILSKGKIQVLVQQITEEKPGGRKQPMIEIQVSDTGQGIAPEDLSRIFLPFFTRKATGTGLGLSISQRIIIEHGGSIEVTSTPNKGTTFYVKLPIPGQSGEP